MADISDLKALVAGAKLSESEAMTRELLQQGLDPVRILEDGIIQALDDLGKRFEARKALVPDLVKGGMIAKACIPHIEAALPKGSVPKQPHKVMIGTMLSQHNIGKNLVSTFLSLGGFDVIDIGEKNEPWRFYEKSQEVKPDIIAVSIMFIPAREKFVEMIDIFKQMRVRDKYRVIVGGAITNGEWAKEAGADGWAPNAQRGVELTRNLLGVA